MAPDGGPTPEDRARAQARVKAEMQRAAAQERADAAARAERLAGEEADRKRRNRAAADAEREKLDNEKVLVHDSDGWDRKPRAQIDAEGRAEAAGRSAAIRGTGVPAAPGSTTRNAKGWQNEKVMVHDSRGWTEKTRGQVAQERANRAYEETKSPIISNCTPGGCTDTNGHFYSGGPVLYVSEDGRSCTRSGSVLECE